MTYTFIAGFFIGACVLYALQAAGLAPIASPQEAGITVGVVAMCLRYDRDRAAT